MLQTIASLSRLFSDSDIPFIHYRITENLFCKYFKATNLSRSDISYDAQIENLGIGIKTFQLKNNYSFEKIAEFNKLSSQLRLLGGKQLAIKVASLRNDRINMADNICNIDSRKYHIIGRQNSELIIFNSPYNKIDLDNISDIKTDKAGNSVTFNDSINEYKYYHSKSVLLKKFTVTSDNIICPVNIMRDPYLMLETLQHSEYAKFSPKQTIILPLYSESGKIRNVPLSSGLNQWNAKGRKRNPNELYISIPQYIHNTFPNFFPNTKTDFNLHLPNNSTIRAKVCQQGDKALMSNPNCALGKWILRDVMNLHEWEIATINKLDELGFDSVVLTKIDENNFAISISTDSNYSKFKTPH